MPRNKLDVKLTININNKPVNLFLIDALIVDIKKKKEFSSMDEDLVFHEVVKAIKKSSKTTKVLSERSLDTIQRSKEYKSILKDVRRTLHRLYGMFQLKDVSKRKELLQELKKNISSRKKSLQTHDEILKTHSSTQERLKIYPELYKKIFRITKKPKKIIDVGSGLNPVSFPYMHLDRVNYTALDISLNDIDFLKQYFKIMKSINGKARVVNLLNAEKENVFRSMRKVDMAFLFKVLEVIELNKKHKISENLIKTIPARWVVVSFPTMTLTKKLMNYLKRGWMHLMLERLKYEYHLIKEKNEIFYVIKK